MRSIGLLAVVTGMLMLASACGGGGGISPSDNTAPVANFDVPACTLNVPCSFASTSTDDAAVTGWSWDFDGDGIPDSGKADTVFTYTTAGEFNVSLTVQDAEGLSSKKTSTISIASVNPTPTAGFTHSCNAADCSFTSTSTDVAPGIISIYAWSFGDGGTAAVKDPSHSYIVTTPTDFTVTLTVTDNEGAADVETQTVSVVPAPNTPPTAGFTHTCHAADCTFTSTSTDLPPGTIMTYAWTFGDGATAAESNPTHSYNVIAPTDFTVTLTVTDNEGATDVETQTVVVSPAPPVAEGCTTSGVRVDCVVTMIAQSTARLTLLGVSCDLRGSSVTVPQPIGDQVFLNVCLRTAGEELGVFGGPTDSLIVFEAGSQLRVRFTQGTPRRGDPAVGPPSAHLEGTFPDWTISIEDGGNASGTGEPDFTDVVVGIKAAEVH
ncbi:MAG: PKD domain-containing protein [Gemmatimonadales bacterium]